MKIDPRENKKQLKALCEVCAKVIDALDSEMAKPSSNERGRRIAKISNALEMQYDAARHFGLGESLKSDKRRKQ